MSNPEWDRLLTACQKGHAELVRAYIEKEGVDPNHANAIRQSALHVAAWWARADCIQVLLSLGANVHAQNTITGATPLHCLFQSGKASADSEQRLRSIRLLLEYGANPQALDYSQKAPMDYMDKNDPDIFAFAEFMNPPSNKHRQNVVQAIGSRHLKDFQKHLALMIETASTVSTSEQRKLLLDILSELTSQFCDCGLDLTDEDSSTPESLLLLTFFQKAFYQLLALPEMDVHTLWAVTSSENTCAEQLCDSIVRYFGRIQKIQNPWLSAWIGVVDSLLRARLQVSPATTPPLSPLPDPIAQHWITIARRNFWDLANVWTAWGVPHYLVYNRQKMTPLQFASRSGHVDMVHLLVDLVMRQDAVLPKLLSHRDQLGITPLAAAEKNGHTSVAEYLQTLQQSFDGSKKT